MKHVKQTLAIALTLLMLVTAVPFSAFGAALTPEQQKCEHTWGNSIDLATSEVAEAATCKTKAKYYKTCTKCGASAGEVDGAKNQVIEYAAGSFDPNNHPTNKIVPVKPEAAGNVICQTGGWTPGKKCEACGKVIEEPKEYASAQAHKAAPGKEANCQTPAICEYCGKEFGNKDPNNHPKDQVTTIKAGKEPSCGEAGKKALLYCNACKTTAQNDDPIPATGKHTQKTAATCKKKAVCAVCGQEYGEVDASAHTIVKHDAKTANCKEAGGMLYYECTECGKYFEDAAGKKEITDKTKVTTKVDPATHKNLLAFNKKDATCSAEGNIAYWYCDGCGKYYSDKDAKTEIKKEDTVVKKTDHTWGNYVYPADYDCAKGGEVSRSCTVCGTSEKVTAKPGEHVELVTEKGVEATCTTAGKTDKIYCKKCGTVLTDAKEIPAKGHTFEGAKATGKGDGTHTLLCTVCNQPGDPVPCVDTNHDCKCDTCEQALSHVFTNYVPDNNATCAADGTKTATCDVCGKATDTIPDEGSKATAAHQYEWTPLNDATCIANGHEKGVCRICEATTIREIPDSATGHIESDWMYPEGYDCEVGGTRFRECTVCHQMIVTETIEGRAHSEAIDPEVPKTCTTDGKSAGVHCDICGKVITAQVIYKAEGHKADENGFITTRPATCTTDGQQTATCGVCGQKFSKELKAAGHSLVDTVVPPTCVNAGYTLHKCSVCGEENKTNITPATGHKMVQKITPATTSENGKLVQTCSVCGKKETIKIYKIKKIALSATTFVRDSKSHKPSVVVTDSKGNKLKKNTDFTVKYASGRKKTGTYKVVVTFKGEYKGKKTLKFKIVPPAVKDLKAKAGVKSATLTWSRNKFADTYVIYCATAKDGKYKKLGSTDKLTFTATKLATGSTYYFKVVAVRKLDSGNYKSADSAIKKAKIK